MPALRFAKSGLDRIDSTIQDYSAILYKQERINGVLGEEEVAFVKVRHQPFSVYMYFLKPNRGRECLYVDPTGPARTASSTPWTADGNAASASFPSTPLVTSP